MLMAPLACWETRDDDGLKLRRLGIGGIEETTTHRKWIVVGAVDAAGHHRRRLHAAKATAIGQALRDGKAVVIEVEETGRACR